MSEKDLKTLGHSIGFSPMLDNPRATRYNPVQAGAAGHKGWRQVKESIKRPE